MRLDKISLDSPFAIPIDEAMVDLLEQAYRRQIPVSVEAVPLEAIRVHSEQALAKVQGALLEHPSIREGMEPVVRERPLLWVHRHGGELCQFDNYCAYVVAREIGMKLIVVLILGEGSRWLDRTKDGRYRLSPER